MPKLDAKGGIIACFRWQRSRARWGDVGDLFWRAKFFRCTEFLARESAFGWQSGTTESDDGVQSGGVEVTLQHFSACRVLRTLGPMPPYFLGQPEITVTDGST